jgi:hypothetical protein
METSNPIHSKQEKARWQEEDGRMITSQKKRTTQHPHSSLPAAKGGVAATRVMRGKQGCQHHSMSYSQLHWSYKVMQLATQPPRQPQVDQALGFPRCDVAAIHKPAASDYAEGVNLVA